MNHNDLNTSLNKSEPMKNNEENFFTNFVNDLQKFVNNVINKPSLNNMLEDSIYVVRDINDEKLSVVNIENGNESDIYIAFSKNKLAELRDNGISDNIYEMSKEDFYSLNLGSNLIIKNGSCSIYSGDVVIKNSEAAAKLDDMYFNLEQEKNAIYSVENISDGKIYLTDTEEGGYFSIPQDAYPDFKTGDLVKNVNGKYVLI